MWATALRLLRKHWLELAWVAFAAANLAAMAVLAGEDGGTVPFHFIWVTLTLLYGYTVWRIWPTAIVLALVMISTAGMILLEVGRGPTRPDELTEVPLMAAMFLAMVWHARKRQAAMHELERSSQREREFVRDVSHHLRTPITIALGHADLIRQAATDRQLRDDAELVIEELERVSTISDRLLLLVSAKDERMLDRREVDVGWLLYETARRWTGAAPRSWIVRDEAAGTLLGDEERLSLALDCLVENAVKATDVADTISISSRRSGSVVALEVSDSGTGLAPEDRERIFDRFARGAKRGRSDGGGAGLGLALVRAIVEAHGGSVGVASSPGEGATFRLRLPEFRPYASGASGADYVATTNGNGSAGRRDFQLTGRDRS